MENFVLIVTNYKNHWSDMTRQLEERGTSFYPKTEEEFDMLKALCDCSFSMREDIASSAEAVIREIVNELPENFFSLFRFEIVEGGASQDSVLFSWFYEKFLIKKPPIKPIVYFQFGGNCTCGCCCDKRREQENEVVGYCREKGLPYFYWSEDGKFFTKDKYEMIKIARKELSLLDVLAE